MSAIHMTCEKCGQRFITGVVGQTPWAKHECPEDRPLNEREPTQRMVR